MTRFSLHATTRLRALGLILVVLGILPPSDIRADKQLAKRVRAASKKGDYVAPSPDELSRLEELFMRTLRSPTDLDLKGRWGELGMRLESLEIDGQRAWLVSEAPDQMRGWGFYWIRPDQLPGLVLQTPHSYSDQFTRNVAVRLLSDGHFGAAAWNTVHRRTVDVAHTWDHPFTAFTRGTLRAFPDSRVVQIHGFQQQKRKTAAGASADLIISNGTRYPARWVRKTAVLMQSGLSAYGTVHLFPTTVNELGATTNVQGEVIRHLGSDHFAHFEMSHALRVRMVADVELRRQFLKNLAEGAD